MAETIRGCLLQGSERLRPSWHTAFGGPADGVGACLLRGSDCDPLGQTAFGGPADGCGRPVDGCGRPVDEGGRPVDGGGSGHLDVLIAGNHWWR